MKIAFLTELFHPHVAGCERRFLEIGKRLAKRGHDVHVFTIRFDARLPKEENVDGMTVHRYALSRNYSAVPNSRSLVGVLKYSFMTAAKLFAKDFEVCYCNEWPILHSVFARPFASPLIQEWCEVWVQSFKVMMLEGVLKSVGAHHVAVSEFTKHRLTHFLGVEPDKISVIPNGVDYSRFNENSRSKTFGRLIYVGRLMPHKRVDMIIETFRRVKEKAPNAELHVIGSGPCLASVRNQARGVDDCFIHGFLPENEMMRIMASSSLFIFPSEREGSGMVALEAMASGTPVITADFPDNATKEIVNGKNGLVVAPTVDALVDTVLALLNNEPLLLTMSRYAHSFAKDYDWDLLVTRFEEVLKEVAA